MNYRKIYFASNPGTMRIHGKRIRREWKCAKCGCWLSRSKVTVDHRIPRRKGGTDDAWNLQAMCRHCNSSKGSSQSVFETISTLTRAAVHGALIKATFSMVLRKLKDIAGIGYTRDCAGNCRNRYRVGRINRPGRLKPQRKPKTRHKQQGRERNSSKQKRKMGQANTPISRRFIISLIFQTLTAIIAAAAIIAYM